MRNLVLLILVVMATACRQQNNRAILKSDVSNGAENIRAEIPNVKKLPDALLTLNNPPQVTDIKFDENFFGKFFCDRAEFFMIEKPEYEIYSVKPESIILYYIDGGLRQTRYNLGTDITNELLQALGEFRIQGFDQKNKDIIKTQPILIRTGNGLVLNENLSNYELKWTFGDKQIKYRVNNTVMHPEFVYLERLKSYEKLYNQVEKYCI